MLNRKHLIAVVIATAALVGCGDNPDANMKMIEHTVDALKAARVKGTLEHDSMGSVLRASNETELGPKQRTRLKIDFDFTDPNQE